MRPTLNHPDDSPADPAQLVEERPDDHGHSRAGAAWVGIVFFALVLVLIAAFVIANTNTVEVSFIFWSVHVPLAVALMVAIASGILVTSLAGTIRIVQLRRRLRQERRRN